MSGVKAGLANAIQNAEVAGNPAANAGQNEPSIDDILASIRQIISEQNRQADNAAEKAAAQVANKAVASANVESIIGTVSAGHWSDNPALRADKHEVANVSPANSLPLSVETPASQAGNLSELEELIQLIGSSPEALAPIHPKWADPVPDDSMPHPVPPAIVRQREPLTVDASSVRSSGTEGVAIPVVQLPATDKPENLLPASKPAVRLHPSISPKADVPQIIKDAINQPAMSRVIATSKPVEANKLMVSPKSALDRLIAKKDGGTTRPIGAETSMELQPNPVVDPSPITAAVAPVQAPVNSPIQGTKTSPPVTNPAVSDAQVSAKAVNATVVESIERLAATMFIDRKEEIDGMMAGIVRPMLQDWLEDNLPSLVERIVREEIERVSRGTHR